MQEIPGCEAPAFWVEHCSSTFDAAWELVGQGRLPVWGAVLAGSQHAGRGQVRRPWISPPGNLYASFVLPGALAALGDMASLATGYLVARALGACGVPALLKWPNDILLETPGREERQGKAGGILLEERQGSLLAGLGLNLLHAPPPESLRQDHAAPAASLAAYGFTPRELWPVLLRHMREVCAERIAGRQPEHIRPFLEDVLAWKGRFVSAHDANEEVRGVLAGLDDTGRLLIKAESGGIRVVESGSLRCI